MFEHVSTATYPEKPYCVASGWPCELWDSTALLSCQLETCKEKPWRTAQLGVLRALSQLCRISPVPVLCEHRLYITTGASWAFSFYIQGMELNFHLQAPQLLDGL